MAEVAGGARMIIGESDQQALDWATDPQGINSYYLGYIWNVLQRANYTAVLKPYPATADAELAVARMIANAMVHGSARTVTKKLVAIRSRVGPFGTLLRAAAMHGGGVNQERERATPCGGSRKKSCPLWAERRSADGPARYCRVVQASSREYVSRERRPERRQMTFRQ